MSNFQPVVFKKAEQYGKEIEVIDSSATKTRLQTWLKQSKVVKPIYINSYDETKTVDIERDYPIDVKVIGDGYYSRGSKQYRVYVRGHRGGSKRFVQSSKEGFLDMAKVLALVTEIVTENNAAYESSWESHNSQKNFEQRLKDCNELLKGTGFRLDNGYRSSFKIEKEDGYGFYESDIEEVVAKLLTLKK